MRVMCFGDSNTFGTPPHGADPVARYDAVDRWPRVMGQALGCEVIEEGLPGRTTDLSDPTLPEIGGAGMDGAAYLPAALASHLPLDWVVILLGTNDLKSMYARTPLRVAIGAATLVDIAQSIGGGVGTPYSSPRVLLLAPPPLGRMSHFSEMFVGGQEKARALPGLYAAMAAAAGCAFLDCGTVIATDGFDGLHWTATTQRRLGAAVAERLLKFRDDGEVARTSRDLGS